MFHIFSALKKGKVGLQISAEHQINPPTVFSVGVFLFTEWVLHDVGASLQGICPKCSLWYLVTLFVNMKVWSLL